MGWYTTALAEVVFCKETYNSLDEVESAIEDCKKMIAFYKRQLHDYAITNPKDRQGKDETFQDTLNNISNDIDEDFEELENEQYHLFRLELLKEFWETRDGDFVNNPDIKEGMDKFIKKHIEPSIKYQEDKKNNPNKLI